MISLKVDSFFTTPGWERRAIAIARGHTCYIKNKHAIYCIPKILHGVFLKYCMVHSFSTFHITIFTIPRRGFRGSRGGNCCITVVLILYKYRCKKNAWREKWNENLRKITVKVSERTLFVNLVYILFTLFNLLVELDLFTEMDPNCYYSIADGLCATWASCGGTVRYVPHH